MTLRPAGRSQVQEAYSIEVDPQNTEWLHRTYYYLLEGYYERRTASLKDDLISFEVGAIVEVDSETIPYYNVSQRVRMLGYKPFDVS